ncbi:unnamed protein product [Bursaphelenchus xylophilus]|uniref:(pine wood nematode) hypothetical protein n=1 Tax=Bursaphelenchus xylophilus TaxID=6326 RepID=A0A1I7SQJ3_BURXY|nr:unnamed protein product [Bursaphelenchus xylophilus]CAG9109986.1 unnamed protein product [Bursaphelenchus xylophilus]
MYKDYRYYVSDTEAEEWLRIHLLNSVFIITTAYIVTYVYYRKTQKYLQRYEANVRPATLKAQKQVGMILALQALYPMIVLGIPIIIGNLVPIIGINSSTLGNVLISIVHTTPILNAVSIIIFVPSYRRATVACFQAVYKCKLDECKSNSVYNVSDKDVHPRSTTMGTTA